MKSKPPTLLPSPTCGPGSHRLQPFLQGALLVLCILNPDDLLACLRQSLNCGTTYGLLARKHEALAHSRYDPPLNSDGDYV